MTRIAVFASGRGSNFEALAAAAREGRVPARIALLLSDREDAGALDVAARFGIEAVALKPAGRRGALDADWEAACLAACRRAASRRDVSIKAGYSSRKERIQLGSNPIIGQPFST